MDAHLRTHLNDGVIHVHVVLLADGRRWQLAQEHLDGDKELQDSSLLLKRVLMTVIACICQRLCCY